MYANDIEKPLLAIAVPPLCELFNLNSNDELAPSELGTNLYGLVDDMQKRKGTGLEGAQQAFYEARTEELRANIANMPEDNLRRSLDSVNDSIKLIQEGIGDESQLANYEMVRFALLQRLAELKGLDMSSSPLAGGASIN